MAAPITSIKLKALTSAETEQEKLAELQSLIAEQEQAINKILEITGELNDIGVLDAVQAMIKAKEDIAEIAVNQASREPITNLVNHVLNASGMLTSIDPEVTEKLAAGVKSGLHEIELHGGNNETISVFDLMKSLKDPDVNRAIQFGLHFLKGMGKGLDER
ncbi:DUF1641 domain-containing protein [Sporosarcina sp. G11-34]|uniref:DUF1641 domain-containing protein n=1 Tax=Sporosarcina sp. G11-34 TaxID=2849605 RepID=UPI0022A99F9E|nr:DUF1641 domain-containing protein [Sporosarcina sp. G11-34]MCZ2258336.1 DUF1641 domain-containing protein [Sporosarcina sp. G11-34]